MMKKNLFCVARKTKYEINFARKMGTNEDDVIIKEVHDKGIIILNRPKALNTINLSLLNKMYPVLKKWETKKNMVIIKGAGGTAFCAGADLKSLTMSSLKGNKQIVADFLKSAYKTIGLVGSYKLPYVSLIDGIVMGGGVGMTVYTGYRIATERTVFAMPENRIGLHPNAGMSYLFPRMSGRLGWYLALTGVSLKGSDVFRAGIATHYVESKDLNNLELALVNCTNNGDVEKVLTNFSKKVTAEFSLNPFLDQIDKCFAAESMEEILTRLEDDGSKWAKDTLKLLNKMSPTSLKITLKAMELGKRMSLRECWKMDFILDMNFFENNDIYEGVRAYLIDKDQNPKWNPSSVAEVSDDLVNSHFREVPGSDDLLHR